MKTGRKLTIAIAVGVLLSVVAGQLSTSSYPPCALTNRGIGVPVDGCVKKPKTSDYPCKNEKAKTDAMANCVKANYYRIKTFPFGFEQKFGSANYKENKKPLILNSIGVSVLGFALTLVAIKIISAKKAKAKLNPKEKTSRLKRLKKIKIPKIKKAKTKKSDKKTASKPTTTDKEN